MHLSYTLALAAALPSAMGWTLTLYSEEDCNDHVGKDGGYMIVEGQGETPYCIGPGSDHFPPGVFCTYYGPQSDHHPVNCEGQIDLFKSWVVNEGLFQTWTGYDSSKEVNLRCDGVQRYPNEDQTKFKFLQDLFPFKGKDHPTWFGVEERGCRNAWWQEKKAFGKIVRHERYFKGITAMDHQRPTLPNVGPILKPLRGQEEEQTE